jgi:biotin synthase
VNLLDPRQGTRLENRPRLNPREGLRILAMFRFMMPDREIRIAGGREAVLRSLQPLALFAANSMFTEGYLTTPGQSAERDGQMLEDAGFTIGKLVASD